MTAEIDRRSALSGAVAALAAAALSPVFPHSALAAAKVKTHRIEIHKFKFTPATLRVRPGDTVLWINRDIVPHTATALDKGWDTGNITQGETRSLQITREMTPSYFCRHHPGMRAKLEVT